MNIWQNLNFIKNLSLNEIDIYKINLTNISYDNIFAKVDLLSAEEQTRFLKYRFKADKKRFAVARIVTKSILSKYLKISDLSQITFSLSPYGKPMVDNNGTLLIHFNISHSENIILLAFSRDQPIGIDVEFQKTNVDLLLIAKRFYSKKEYEALKHLNGQDLLEAFYYCWTRKESIIKAIGQGLSFPLDQFAVSLSATSPKLESTYWDSLEKKKWSIGNIQLENQYTAAFAIRQLDFLVNYFEASYFAKKIFDDNFTV